MGQPAMTPYYEEAGITIFHGDCRVIVPQLGRFDLLLTDPPYGINIAANPVRQKHAKKDWDADVPEDYVIPMMVAHCDQAIVWGGNYFRLPPQQGFFVWDKGQPQDFSLAMCEQAWSNIKQPAKIFRKSVLSYGKEHPTQKPVELMQWCIGFASPALRILDPFAGSGTTGEAAKNLGRQAILIEREEEFCEIAARRLAQEVLAL